MNRDVRFCFGANWRRFVADVDSDRLTAAANSLMSVLGVDEVREKTFLDVGSGSGLFSAAAVSLSAARVHSFDFDEHSVEATREVKRRFFPDAVGWTIERGDILDRAYLSRLGQWDVVHAWGVVHHTGAMWRALENLFPLLKDGGHLYVAIYNDQGAMSSYWAGVKRLYVHSPTAIQTVMEYLFFTWFAAGWLCADVLRSHNPRARYGKMTRRGMSAYRDVVDWIGGYPFEAARPETVFRFCQDRGLRLRELKTCGGRHGCNEFVFVKDAPSHVDPEQEPSLR
jgi:2-polyprenyl-3-methyl-5-hydroxy-6-metoxy-1,4-benzoquinol methylase